MSPVRLAALTLTLAALAVPCRALAPPEKPLMDRMRSAGLDGIEPLAGSPAAVHGILGGEGARTVLLFAGCGAGAVASRDAALKAVADLARTPRRHTLELVVCTAGGSAPHAARRAAASWLDRHPTAPERDALLAALHLEVGDRAGGAPVGLMLAATGADGRRLPPAWLAHAALTGARSTGGLGIGHPGWPLAGQLLGRYGRLRATSGAEPFLAAGVPAMTFAGVAPESGWAVAVAGIVRRLDALAGRPRDDDIYLALGGRVWARRDLYWVGFLFWVVLVGGRLPGAWRGADAGQRQRRGRRYLPGFAFRMLFLVALLMAPVGTLLLLTPAALLTLALVRRPPAVWIATGLALAPVALFAGYWALGVVLGRVAPWPAQPLRLALVLGGVALAVVLLRRPFAGGSTVTTG